MNGQLNVTPIESKQPQPACRFSITATLDGFPFTVEGEGKAGDLRAIVDRLKAIGATPPQPGNTLLPGSEVTKLLPTCPEHGTAKPSKKPGSFYCPKSLPDGGFCKWTGKA